MTLKAFYGLPKKVIFCKKTLISNQLPNSAIEFKHTIKSKKKTTFIDKNGISDPWKYSRIKNPIICNLLVKIAIPVNNKIVPPNFVITDIYFLKFFENNKNLSIKIPEIIKGMAKPKEYVDNNIIPLPIFSSNVANVIIDPRIGPIQGVHPNPKAMPTINGKARLSLYCLVKNLISLFMKFKFIIPITCSEKKTIIIPAIILKVFEFIRKKFPIKVAVEPKAIKTKEKPKVKKTVFNIIKFFPFSFILSKDVPVI